MKDQKVSSKIRSQGRFEPLNVQIFRQSKVIERHEKIIAQHTAVQSWTNVANLIFGLITTAALIYIAYQQYIASDRQVRLEYAKVSPQFHVDMDFFATKTSAAVSSKVPRKISIRLGRGEATIQRIDTYQDFRVALLRQSAKGDYRHLNCQVRVKNYFRMNENLTDGDVNPIINRIGNEPVFYYPDIFDNFYIISPESTYVKIYYTDIFGEERSSIFSGAGSRLSKLPSVKIPEKSLFEIIEIELKDYRKYQFPSIFIKPETPPQSQGCKYILNKSDLAN